MTGNKNAWRAPLAGLASVAMVATMGVAASTANAVEFGGVPQNVAATSGVPSFKVTFDLNGRGQWTSGKAYEATLTADAVDGYALTETVQEGAYDAIKANTAGVGFVFTGWYDAAQGGNRVAPGQRFFADTTLYAHWANSDTNPDVTGDQSDVYVYTYNTLGTATTVTDSLLEHAGTITSVSNQTAVAKGDVLASWQKPGDDGDDASIVTGWSTRSNDATGKVDLDAAPTESRNLYPLTTDGVSVTYSLHYASGYQFANGGTTDQTVWKAKGSDFPTPTVVSSTVSDILGITGETADAVKFYKMATKWDVYDTADLVAGKKTPASLTKVEKNTHAYANVSDASTLLKAYKVSFAVNDSSDANNVAAKDEWAPQKNDGSNGYAFGYPGDQYVPAGQAVSLPTPDLYGGLYKVKNWYYGKGVNRTPARYTTQAIEKIAADDAVTNDGGVALHAVLVVANAPTLQRTVTFDPNYTGSKPTTVKVNDGDTLVGKVPADPTREGYTFVGWNSDKNANADTTVDSGWLKASDPVKGQDQTFYAIWLPTSQYELSRLLAIVNTEVVPDNNSVKTYTLYTTNSYDQYEKVRAQLSKDSEGIITAKSGGSPATSNGELYGYKADFNDATLTDETIADWVKTLSAAAGKLVYSADIQNAFSDVDESTPHYGDIWDLTAQGVVKGFQAADGSYYFGGEQQIKRQDFAAYLYRLAGEPAFDEATASKTFADVTADDEANHSKAVLWAASNGIINGFPDNTFGGQKLIKRQDAMAMIYRLAGSPRYDANTNAEFTDVTAGDDANHATAILWAASKGIAQGFPDGSFRGQDQIKRQDAAAFLNRIQINSGLDIKAIYDK